MDHVRTECLLIIIRLLAHGRVEIGREIPLRYIGGAVCTRRRNSSSTAEYQENYNGRNDAEADQSSHDSTSDRAYVRFFGR